MVTLRDAITESTTNRGQEMTTEAYIFDAVRTPRGRGKKDGALHSVKPITLLTTVLKALQERNSLDTAQVDDIVMGCVTAVGDQGADIAKTAALAADWDEVVAGVTLNRFCASGLEAVNLAAMKVRSGWEDLVVAGGVEGMSRVPMGSDGGAWATDPATNLHTGFMPQGIGADLIATLEGFSREDVDGFAVKSQQKAANAWEKGYFSKSIVPVTDQNGVMILDRDEHVRGNTTVESLSSLKPSFQMMGEMGFDGVAREKYHYVEKINHVHHAGNSSGIVDGATALLIGSEAKGKAMGLKPRARILATAVTSTDPTIMLTGPAPAARKSWHDSRPDRLVRSKRSVCLRGDALPEGVVGSGRKSERERRCYRHGPPTGGHWRYDPGHPARRTGAERTALRPGHPVCGWWNGYCHHH